MVDLGGPRELPPHRKTKVELWLLFAAPQFARLLRVERTEVRPEDTSAIDRIYGTADWRHIYERVLAGEIEPGEARDEYFNLMRWRLEHELGYRWTHPLKVRNEQGGPIYFMVFATDHSVGTKIMSDLMPEPPRSSRPCARTPGDFADAWKRRPTACRASLAKMSLLDAPAKPGEHFYEHEPPWRPRPYGPMLEWILNGQLEYCSPNDDNSGCRIGLAVGTDHQDIRRRLFAQAAEQAGYFTAGQAKVIGYSYQAQAHHVRVGNWLRVDRGIFRFADWMPDLHDETPVGAVVQRARRGVPRDRPRCSQHRGVRVSSCAFSLSRPASPCATLPSSFTTPTCRLATSSGVRASVSRTQRRRADRHRLHGPGRACLTGPSRRQSSAAWATVRKLRARARPSTYARALYIERARS